tara:strand:- start:211 stop:531 length:321 start_codon:yes stop_codon:yes gene_type:complete
MRLLLLLLPFVCFSQIDYSGINQVDIADDLFYEEPQIGTVIRTYNPNPYSSFINQGKVITSFEADSDFDAIIEAQWKTDFIIRPGEQVKDALVRGQTKYYIIRWEQ